MNHHQYHRHPARIHHHPIPYTIAITTSSNHHQLSNTNHSSPKLPKLIQNRAVMVVHVWAMIGKQPELSKVRTPASPSKRCSKTCNRHCHSHHNHRRHRERTFLMPRVEPGRCNPTVRTLVRMPARHPQDLPPNSIHRQLCHLLLRVGIGYRHPIMGKDKQIIQVYLRTAHDANNILALFVL